jgi:hypothetical protein
MGTTRWYSRIGTCNISGVALAGGTEAAGG